MQREGPYTVPRGFVLADGYILTNVEWHPNEWFGDFAQNETGIQRKGDEFRLIQHGWRNFEDACKLILKALAKGWDEYRITILMTWLANRRFR